MSNKLLLFIHGLGGKPKATWGQFPDLVGGDADLPNIKYAHFSYPTRIFVLPFLGKYSDIRTLAQSLSTQINNRFANYDDITLVCHSLGGLIAKQYLINEIMGRQPLKVKQIIFFAVPHNGSTLASIGSYISGWNRQLKQICKNSDIVRGINEAWSYCKVPDLIDTHYVVAALDRAVDEESSKSHWGQTSVEVINDRNHINCVKPQSRDDLAYIILKNKVIAQYLSTPANKTPNSYFAATVSAKMDKPNDAMTQEVRISMAALIRAEHGGKYLTIRNAHRPETFGPIGGVFKIVNSNIAGLDRFNFRPESIHNEMADDLRGYVSGEKLEGFKEWFSEGRFRENTSECLCRELEEEFGEIGVPLPFALGDLRFHPVRTIVEEPAYLAAIGKTQYRVFEIYRFADGRLSCDQVMAKLNEASSQTTDLKWVTAEEAKKGRCFDGTLLGSHVPYLFGDIRYHQHDAPL